MSRLPRYWADSNLPRPISPRIKEEGLKVDIFTELDRMIGEVRDDPDRLSTALAAWCRLGYPPGNWDVGLERQVNGQSWDREFARQKAADALRGRPRKVLTARADGLILGLICLATEARAHRAHEVRVESAVIECRVLSIDERIAKLRSMDQDHRLDPETGRAYRIVRTIPDHDNGLDAMGAEIAPVEGGCVKIVNYQHDWRQWRLAIDSTTPIT